MYIVRKRKLGIVPQIDALSRASGSLYTETVVWFWRHVRRHHRWLSKGAMQRRLRNGQPTTLHSQSAQAAIQSFCGALDGWRAARTLNPYLKPPYKRKRFFKIIWKASAIRIKDSCLLLANAKGTPALVIVDWRYDLPVQVEIGWDGTQHELRAVYTVPAASEQVGDVGSADLGEVHYATVGTEEFALILNGRLLRAKRRYRNKVAASFQTKLFKKRRGSRRWKQLSCTKGKVLRRLDHQIRDIEHKLSTMAITTLHARGVRTLVVGDVRDIRVGNDKGVVHNQRLHQAPLGRARHYLTYKARLRGWLVAAPQDEAYTSQECPACGARSKPRGRQYRCHACGLVAHRDVVGQVNILRKYRGFGHVVGAMASPIGVRYHPDLRCRSAA